jgi:hypothetical protein
VLVQTIVNTIKLCYDCNKNTHIVILKVAASATHPFPYIFVVFMFPRMPSGHTCHLYIYIYIYILIYLKWTDNKGN